MLRRPARERFRSSLTKAGVFIASAFVLASGSLFAANIWDGGGATNNWSDVNNWDNNALPGYGTLTFSGTARPTNTDDSNTNINGGNALNQINFNSTVAFTLNASNGANLRFFDNGGTQAKIENNGSALGTMNIPIQFAATAGTRQAEINAVTSDLTFGSTATIDLSGSFVDGLQFFGNGHTVTLNGVISESGTKSTGGAARYVQLNGTNTVIFGAANLYTGNTLINNGTLKLGVTNGIPTGSTVTLGNAAVNGVLDLNGKSQQLPGLLTSGSGTANNVINSSGTNGILNLNIAGGTDTFGGFLGNGATNRNFSLVKDGAGTLTLTNNNNSYNQGTTINNGVISVSAFGGIGSTAASNTLTFNGGTLQTTGTTSRSGQAVIINSGGGTFDVTTGTTTITSDATHLISGTGALTKTSAGTLTLSGVANTFSGLNLNGGTVSSTVQGAIGTGALSFNTGTLSIDTNAQTYSNNVTLAGAGTIAANANAAFNGTFSNGANRLTVTGSANTTLGGAITSTNDVLKQGTGTLTFSTTNPSWASANATNTNLFVDSGTVAVGSGGDIGATNGTTTGRIAFGSSNPGTAGDLSLLLTSAGTTLANPIDVRFFAGVTSGKLIGGTNTSGTVEYSGGITLHDTVTLSASGAGGNGTTKFSGVIATGTAGSPYASETVNTANVLFAAGPGVIITGPGTVEYDNTNTYSSETYVKSGTLQFNGSGSANSSTIRLGDDVASSNATVNIATAAGGTTVGSIINPRAGAGGTKTISSTNTSGTNTYSGHIGMDTNLTVLSTNAGGTLAITQTRSSGTDTLTGFDIKSFTATFSGAGDTNVSGTIYNSAAGAGNENAGTGNIVKAGAGTLTLSGNNTFKGTTTINSSGGKLNAAAAGALGSTSSITVNSGGTLMISGSGNLNRINNAAGITLGTTSGAAATFARSGTGTVSEGVGAVRNGGTVTGTSSIGLGALTLASNSTLDFGTGGVGTLTFASFVPAGFVLNILNYTSTANPATPTSGTDGTDDRLIFNQNQSGNLANFSFNGISATEIALDTGFFEVVPIPEPGTWVAGALAFIGLFATQRKRLARIIEAENRRRNFPDNL